MKASQKLKDWEIQHKKDIEYADRKEKALEKHLNTKLNITIQSFRDEVIRIVEHKMKSILSPVVDKEIEARFENNQKQIGDGHAQQLPESNG